MRPAVRVVAALAAGVSLAAIAAPGFAADIRVEIDDRAAELVTLAFERESVNARLLDEILDARGHELTFRDRALRDGRDPAEVKAEFRRSLAAALDGADEPGLGLEGARAHPASYRHALREIRNAAGGVRWRVEQRLDELLPPGGGFAATAYLVVGGEETTRVLGGDVTLRLDEFVPGAGRAAPDGSAPRTPDATLDVDRFASALARSLFHVGYRAAGGPPPRPDRPDAVWDELVERYGYETVGEVWRASGERHWDGEAMAARFEAWVPPPFWSPPALSEVVAMLSRIQSEGCAAYAAAPLLDPGTTRRHAGETAAWMGTVDADFAHLAAILRRFGRAAEAEEIAGLAEEALAGDGPLRRVGYRMAERIDSFSGRRPLVSTVSGGALDFFETYFETHPYGPGQMDAGTEEEIAAVIREIRGMGAFDPEG